MLRVTFVSGEVQYYDSVEPTSNSKVLACLRNDAGLTRLFTKDELASIEEVSAVEATAGLGPNPVRQSNE